MREIRIYIEGGGDGKDTKAALRRGFGEFLSTLRERARQRGVRWRLITCGSRNDTFEAFQWAFENHRDAFNVLLVDSEGPVAAVPREHLHERDGWPLARLPVGQCHLMVQAMEAWLVADPESLGTFFGTGFRQGALPAQVDVEEIPARQLVRRLEAASRGSAKGKYHKIRHGAELLRRVSREKVRTRARHCDQLFEDLDERLGG